MRFNELTISRASARPERSQVADALTSVGRVWCRGSRSRVMSHRLSRRRRDMPVSAAGRWLSAPVRSPSRSPYAVWAAAARSWPTWAKNSPNGYCQLAGDSTLANSAGVWSKNVARRPNAAPTCAGEGFGKEQRPSAGQHSGRPPWRWSRTAVARGPGRPSAVAYAQRAGCVTGVSISAATLAASLPAASAGRPRSSRRFPPGAVQR